jgi:hypothetical protein
MSSKVVISKKFKTKLESMDMLKQSSNLCIKMQKSGLVSKIEDGLYIILDQSSESEVGILDPQSFWEAILSTNLSNFWNVKKKALSN